MILKSMGQASESRRGSDVFKVSLTPFCTILDTLHDAADFSQDKAEGLVCLQN